jgi:hypothetical protein
MKKRVAIYFTTKIMCTFLSITHNIKCHLLENISAYCEYSPTTPFFLLFSEHKYWDNAATNSNSENARSRMVACLQGSVVTVTKEDELSTGHVWAAGFHHVTAISRLAHVLKLINRLFLKFSNFFFWPRQTANSQSADTGVRLYLC